MLRMTKSALLAMAIFLPLSHSQCTTDCPTPTPVQCLKCTSEETPADCTFNHTIPQQITADCSADISNCDIRTCPTGTVCSYDYIRTDMSADWRLASNCIELEPCTPCAGRRVSIEMVFEILCCCSTGDCSNVEANVVFTFSTAVDSSDSTPAMTTGPSPSPTSSSSAVSIAVAVIALVLGLSLFGVALTTILCCRHRIRKLCVRRRPRTSQTGIDRGIDRQYSGRYSQPWVLQGLVGQGRFGQVYKALYNGEVVAVKVYSNHSRTTWENERNLFSLESTRHKHIVDFLTSGSNESGCVVNTSPLQLYLVTHYYPLGTLEEYLRTNVLSWKQACNVVQNIASGLKHLHSENVIMAGIQTEKYPIVHRDIKSSNVLMRDTSGECVIGDLGLAFQLIPTDNPTELSNYGQAGTLRYMSPEALEARVNLQDLQSFKQIDIYAFSLVMWEVMSRCCVLTSDDVGAYALPYADLVSHPTLEAMKDIVCYQQLRPLIPAVWSNHEPLSTFAEMMRECWDDDPDARLTAGNILYQMEDLCNSSPQIQQDQMTQSHASSTSQSHTPSNQHLTDIGHILFQEHSQSSPPPCYSPTDPVLFSIAQNQENRSRMGQAGQNYFRTSMPHILPTAEEGRGPNLVEVITLTPGCTRSLRSSTQQSGWSQYRPPHAQSVRNSLVLGGGRNQMHDGPLPTFSDADSSESSSHSVSGMEIGRVGATCISDTSLLVPQNADSGIQSGQSLHLVSPAAATDCHQVVAVETTL